MRRTLGRSSVIGMGLLAGAASFPAQADLIGATVTIAGYCCTAPTPADLFTNTPTGTVPVSFPVGSFISVTSRAIIPSSFEVTADQIIQTSAASLRAATGSFNGVVYTFSGGPDIIDVIVDPATPLAARPVSILFTNNSIAVNDAGLVTSVGAMQILDITTATGPVPPPAPTPEPSTLALLGAGLAGLAGFGFRRRRRGSGAAKAALGIFSMLTFGHAEAATIMTTETESFSNVNLPFGGPPVFGFIPIAPFDPTTGTLLNTNVSVNTTYRFNGSSSTLFAPFGTQTVNNLNAIYTLTSYDLPTISTPVSQTETCGNLFGCSGSFSSSITTTQTAVTSNSLASSFPPGNGGTIPYELTSTLLPSNWTLSGTQTVSGTVEVTRTIDTTFAPPPPPPPVARAKDRLIPGIGLAIDGTATTLSVIDLLLALPTGGLSTLGLIGEGIGVFGVGFATEVFLDPFDPDYNSKFVPTFHTLPTVPSDATLPLALANEANSIFSEGAQALSYLQATSVSLNRLNSATQVGDLASVALQNFCTG